MKSAPTTASGIRQPQHPGPPRLAMDEHGTAAEPLRDLALDPFGRDVAAKAGDEAVAGAALQSQVTVGIESTEVAGRDFLVRRAWRIPQVAQHDAAADMNLPGFIHP